MVFLGIKDIFIPLLIHMAVSNAVALEAHPMRQRLQLSRRYCRCRFLYFCTSGTEGNVRRENLVFPGGYIP